MSLFRSNPDPRRIGPSRLGARTHSLLCARPHPVVCSDVARSSNIAAVQMLREATGAVVLAVRDTPISKTPRAHSPVPRLTGLRPLVQPS
eukprot:5276174-Pleurochrysis_carterae.AAC.1